MYGMLASDSAIFFSPLQSESTVSSDPHKYFLKFPMDHLTETASPTKLCIEFSSDDTVDTKMKEIGNRRIPFRDLPNSHFKMSFYFDSYFLVSSEKSACRSTTTIPYLDQSILM